MRDLQIVHFESNPAWISTVNAKLRGAPGNIVATANTSLGCFRLVEAMGEGSIEADAVILGDIPDLAGGQPGNHMRGLIGYMAAKELTPRTIGLASVAMEEYGVEVDIDLTQRHAYRLKEVVRRLHTITEAQLSLDAINASCRSHRVPFAR